MSEQNEDRLEAQNRLVTEAAAATEAEQEAREAWHNLLMATVYRERGSLTDPKEPFALAVALSEGGPHWPRRCRRWSWTEPRLTWKR